MKREIRYIESAAGRMRVIILRPRDQRGPLPGILWIHGGGYMLGMADMVHASCGKLLAKRYGAVVVSPAYRLAGKAPFPAALEDCYAALLYLYLHADELGVRRDAIVVGGESAGGGLAVATCLLARDMGEVPVAFQIPLYPMLDSDDTPSSQDNHGKVWNTRRNHWGWRHYLAELQGADWVPAYASPAHATDYAGLPPCYTYVSDGEPFYDETLAYVENLRAAGVKAEVDVFPGDIHAFDLLCPWTRKARAAHNKLYSAYENAIACP